MKRRSFIQGLLAALAIPAVAATTKPDPVVKIVDRKAGSLKIIKHPKGHKLGWKNPYYRMQKRDDGGQHWDGWVPVMWHDSIGRNLGKYLEQPPTAEYPTHAFANGGYVWSGDVFLCKKKV